MWPLCVCPLFGEMPPGHLTCAGGKLSLGGAVGNRNKELSLTWETDTKTDDHNENQREVLMDGALASSGGACQSP